MKVLKFGGSSVGDAARITSVLSIIKGAQEQYGPVVVVASALQDVTNQLVKAGQLAYRGDDSYTEVLSSLEDRHLKVARALFGRPEPSVSELFIRQAFVDLREFIHGIRILGEITKRTVDYLMSYGEQLSCTILAEALRTSGTPAEYVDARLLIQTDLNYEAARVNFDLTNWNILNHFKKASGIQVITGFIARGPENETTTLGRGGSDYTASIIGAAVGAEEIEIWTDVDGVMTADPRRVAEAFPIDTLTFEEAMELSHFGAKVIHPPTMLPALEKRIPIRIRNTFHPEFPGTLIRDRQATTSDSPVKGIACTEHISLLKVTGEGMMQSVGIASRIFATMARNDIEVKVITQSSSEQSICLAVSSEHLRSAREMLELEFRVELHHRLLSAITLEHECAMLAVVGERVQNIPGVTGKVFQALGRNGITPRAIAHGSSDRNLTLVLREADLGKAMNALHDQLFLSRHKTLNIFLLGPGLVGSTLLRLLNDRRESAHSTSRTQFRIVGIANRRKMAFNSQGIDPGRWQAELASGRPTNLDEFTQEVQRSNFANSMVIDCTGSETPIQQYLPLLSSSVSVITSSKVANTLSMEFYRQLRSAAAEHGAEFRYSTNVGAALPIIDSIKSILQNGDSVECIEAVLSGTMSYIFNRLNGGASFSEAVREAQTRGYTEPDPRVDLSGLDVARKLLILVREAGYAMELDDIVREAYLPADFESKADLNAALLACDRHLAARRDDAHKQHKILMFLARFEGGAARVGIEELGPDHPFYHLSGNDNIVSLTTRHLYRQPLVVRGGGAGPDLTASGLFNDIIHISRSMN